MATLLEQAFTKASQLPIEQQNVVATLLLREMESEEGWTELFAKSQDALSELADEALAEFERGETKPLEESLEITND
ncbi:MAG: hypothetical protein JNK38_17340 [Acidobacteria bacterium]|nr:hypothetical protein [Acidobacteriota bacterium]